MSEDSGGLAAGPNSLTTGDLPPRHRRQRRKLPPGSLTVEPVPLPLAGRDRANWRVMTLLLCLSACHGRSATVEQLHVLSWALRDRANAKRLVDAWERRPGAPATLRAWDPSLDDTLALARAAKLIEQKPNGRQALTQLGANLVSAVRDDPGHTLEQEQQFLATLGRLTESGMWRRLGSPPRRNQTTRTEGTR